MYRTELILQDGGLGYQSRIADGITSIAAAHDDFSVVRVAMAYASESGCRALCQQLTGALPKWQKAQKQWLLSIDFGRTDPEAISLLRELPNSQVKLANGRAVLERHLVPERCFHPKTYVFESKKSAALGLFLGSANLTMSGLHTGSEHAVSHLWLPELTSSESATVEAVKHSLLWWDEAWHRATVTDDQLVDEYASLRTKLLPEDETDSVRPLASGGAHEVSIRHGIAWANAQCLWVETHELYKNRGRNQPGNQLDLKRGTRVFFGFPADVVEANHIFGNVRLQFNGKHAVERSMRFGKNSMDKMNLPIPGQEGPPSYDNGVVLFEKQSGRRFIVKLGNAGERKEWLKLSQQQRLVFEMAGGRKFGFFS